MEPIHDILLTLAGLLLCNSLPHLAAGLRGEVFPTPFAKPHGRGPSSPLTNFYWGAANLALGLSVLLRDLSRHPFLPFGPIFLAIGVLAVGTFNSIHFAKARRLPDGFAATDN